MQNKSKGRKVRQPQTTRLNEYILARQCRGLSVVKRERWSERDLTDLPAEEPDKFDRKAGRLFDDQAAFLNSVAKALSAFANSGGGSLILGVEDDGTPDGLPMVIGRTAMRDWIEQKIPHVLDYPLSDFRVHTVIKDGPSRIPAERAVIVIDVGDSAAAPHQSKRDHIYYHRVGGRSVPAPHFYLELLRQRLTNPALEFSLSVIELVDASEHDDGIFVETKLVFEIKNVGRVASYNWNLVVREMNNTREDVFPMRKDDYYFNTAAYPVKKARSSGIPINTTILPGCEYIERRDFGFQLRSVQHTINAVCEDLKALLAGTTLFYRLAAETSPGELVSIELSTRLDVKALEAAVRTKCLGFYNI
jgi:Putative DNA-binding domain